MVTSRERIKCALEHKESDRIPIDFGGMRSTGISTIAYNKLKMKLDINKKPSRMYDFIQQLAYPEKEILDLFKVDAIDASRGFLKSDKYWREWILNDGSKCLIPKYLDIEIGKDSTVFLKNKEGIILGKKPKNSLYVDHAFWVYGNCQRIPRKLGKNDLTKQMWEIPTPEWSFNIFDKSEYELFANNIKKLYENTDYAILLGVGCSFLERGNYLRGMENFLCDIYQDKKGVGILFDKFLEGYLETLNRLLKEVGQYVDVVVFGDDLGFHNGSIFSLEKFKELFKPRYKKLYDFVHENSNCKVFLHSCGSIYNFLPDLVDIGLDILNPVQTNSYNMNPKKLKKEFGKDITFWGGGCDTANILPNATPKEVKEDVKKRIDIFANGGGFVFSQIHNILADVPPENIIAMFEAANEYSSNI